MRRLGVVSAIGCRAILGIDDPVRVDAGAPPPTVDASPCLAASVYDPGTFAADDQAADSFGSGSALAAIEWFGGLDATTDVVVEIAAGTSDFPQALRPATDIDLGSLADTQFMTCGACVFVLAGIDGSGNAKQDYLAVSGRLDITEATATEIAGSFSNVILTPVTIDTTNVSTRVDPACVTTLTAGTFVSPVTAGSAMLR